MCFCRVSVCLSVRMCVCCHSSCRVLSRMMNVQASVSFSSRVCEQNIYLCATCVCLCVWQGVCEGVRASNEHRYGSVPTQTLEPQAPSPAKYAIKNFTLEHANYEARQLAAAAATGLRVCIAMAILVSVHIFIATFLHGFVFLDSAKC